MSGYFWDPVVRVVPKNAPERVYWFADELSDLGGHRKCTPTYPFEKKDRKDINRVKRSAMYGFRPTVTIETVISTMADQAFLAEIESALMDPNGYDVFLSIDGGVVYRAVELVRQSDPEAIADKTFAGATFRLTMEAKELIPRKPAMMTDPGVGAELVQNGDFEDWPSGTVAQGWTYTGGLLAVSQETVLIHAGLSSAKALRADGSSFASLTQTLAQKPQKGCWYRAQAWHRGTVPLPNNGSGSFRLTIINLTRGVGVSPDGVTWATNASLISSSTSTAFALASGYLRIPGSFAPADAYQFRFDPYFNALESLFYDDVSLYGPVLRPGYSTW